MTLIKTDSVAKDLKVALPMSVLATFMLIPMYGLQGALIGGVSLFLAGMFCFVFMGK